MISEKLKLLLFQLTPATLLITALLSAVAWADVPLDRIVAVVNEDVIMASELQAKLRTIRNQIAQANAEAPPGDLLEKQVLETLILNKLQLQNAASTGILVDDETLNRTINKIAEENRVSLAQFREVLERDGHNYELFREDIRNEITISRLKQRQVDNRITVTDREIDNHLANEQYQGGVENEYRISHILISLPEAATDEEIEQARLVAEKVLEDLASGEDFAKLAATVSEGQQAKQGGDLGWRKQSAVPELFAEHVSKLKEGEVSGLIQNAGGFHIIKLTGLRSSGNFMVTQTHARHILLKPNELLKEVDVIIRLDQLKLRAEGGDDFAELAKSHSEDTVSAVNGGDLGWVTPGDLVPDFENEMNELEPGKISAPFRSQFGWHIVQVLERREHDNSEAQKRGRAREIIRKKKIEEAQQNWLRSLRDEAYVEYRLDDS